MDNIDNSQLCETQIVRVGIGGENFGGNISCKFVGGKPSIDFWLEFPHLISLNPAFQTRLKIRPKMRYRKLKVLKIANYAK